MLEPKRFLSRLNGLFAHLLLAFWPADSASWGVALATERHAVGSPSAQFLWLLGGVRLLAREQIRSFLPSLFRPIGVGPRNSGANISYGRVPRTPKIVLGFLLILFGWLFLQPETLAVFRFVSQDRSSSSCCQPARWPEVRRLHAIAEKNNDPELFAFLSLLSDDRAERLGFADRAIQANPSFVWLDYPNTVFLLEQKTASYESIDPRIDRLVDLDPHNSAAHLLRAESIAIPYWQKSNASWESTVTHDSKWLVAMDSAFSADHYDCYAVNIWQLSRSVTVKYSINDPRLVPAALHWRLPYWGFSLVNSYSEFLFSRASAAERRGEFKSAADLYSRPAQFAATLRAAKALDSKGWFATGLEARSYAQLSSFYERNRRPEQAQRVKAALAQIDAERAALLSLNRNSRPLHWSREEWAGVLMQGSTLAIWVLLPVAVISTVSLWFVRGPFRRTSGRFHSTLCVLSDLAPSFLLFATAILFMTYLPYAEQYRSLLLSDSFPATGLDSFWVAAYAPRILPVSVGNALGSLTGPYGAFLFWLGAIVVLCVVLAFLVRRQLSPRSNT